MSLSQRKSGKAWRRFGTAAKPTTGGYTKVKPPSRSQPIRRSSAATAARPTAIAAAKQQNSTRETLKARGIRANGYTTLGKPVSGVTAVVIMFGEAQRPVFDAHIRSMALNAPGITETVIDPGLAPALGRGLPKFSSVNHHKLKVWAEAVEANRGKNIILIDGDTLIINDPSGMFNNEFDICFTTRDEPVQCINAGVVFVRCNDRTAQFFRRWCEYDKAIVNDPKLFARAQLTIRGQNQASLGLLLTEGDLCDCVIQLAPCAVWNCVNELWATFDESACAVLHVKNGNGKAMFRDFVLGKPSGANLDTVKYRNILATWKKYSKAVTQVNPTVKETDVPARIKKVDTPANAVKQALPVLTKRWEELAYRFAGMKNPRGVELGAWKGQNAAELLRRLPDLTLTMVDMWGAGCVNDGSAYCGFTQAEWDGIKATCASAVRPYGARARIFVTRTTDTGVIDGPVDFVFVDADHSYEGCKADIQAWWPLVKPGGYLCGHDYGVKAKSQHCKPGVTKAVDEFAAAEGVKISCGADATWFVKKAGVEIASPSVKEPVVVAFHCDNETTSGYYANCANELKDSLDRLGMKHDIVKLERTDTAGAAERDNWLAAAAKKVDVIRAAMDKYGAVLYVDCDYLFERKPEPMTGCDVAAVEYVTSYVGKLAYTPLWQAGLMYFADTDKARKVVDSWKKLLVSGAVKDDHIALDTILRASDAKIRTLSEAYSWRGSEKALDVVARAGKRTRVSNVKSNARLLTVWFGDYIAPFISAHKRSIASNVPGAQHDIINPPPPTEDAAGMPAWALPNYHKLKFWRDAVASNAGEDLILLDADTILLKDPRARFDQSKKFDICFTDGVDAKHPINGGVVFVRCNDKTLKFFDTWMKYDERVFRDKQYFEAAQRVAAGQNQASLGMLLKNNDVCGCVVEYVPCQTWNSVNAHWTTFKYAECYILHVKGGAFRDYVLSGRIPPKFDSKKYSAVIAAWNRWCPPGYVRAI